MFDVNRNGTSVEITDIPASIPFRVFKNIADETGANECLVCFSKDKENYEVIIRHDSVHMAATIAWRVSELRRTVTGDVNMSIIGKRIGVMRVKRHMSTSELEDAIAAPRRIGIPLGNRKSNTIRQLYQRPFYCSEMQSRVVIKRKFELIL
ncbi:TPA: hypothetical protein P5S08_004594 [Salmonella enterica subsp. enterica serovar Concord]|nr:hypothetical protein [Salmonella enterica subsp. enterica serovar Concord]